MAGIGVALPSTCCDRGRELKRNSITGKAGTEDSMGMHVDLQVQIICIYLHNVMH